jgi:hypothetical protein
MKALVGKELEQSSCYLLVMAMPGHLGDDSGQKLDKSGSSPSEGERPSRSPSDGKDNPEGLPASRTSRRRRRQLEKAESDAEEIARLVAEAHKLLPMSKAKLRGLIYARYSSDLQHSVVDQVRELMEFAVANGIFISLDLIFWDSGIPGRKKNRPGLNAAKAALASDQADVWLSFNSSRVFRRGYQCMKFVVEDIVGEGKRCIFVKNGIDTATSDSWHALLAIMSFVDEIISKLTVPNILAAHMGLFNNAIVHGTITYGYCGEPIPGNLTKRGLPRCKYLVSEAEAKWVRQVFQWFVVDRLPVREIVRRLNANSEVPAPRINLDGRWTRGSVIGLLGNTRYRGSWSYGRTQNVWNAKKDCGRAVLRNEPLGTKYFEHLRIVGDDIWYGAQQRLMSLKQKYARDRKHNKRSKDTGWILGGLFFCATHQRPLYAQCGGKYLFCPNCKNLVHEQSLFSLLPKELAVRLTIAKVRHLINEDAELVSRVIAACQEASERFQRPDEGQLQCLRKEINRLTRQIKFLLENAGETEDDQKEAQAELKAHRNRRAQVDADLRVAELRAGQEVRVPTESEIRALLGDLERLINADRGIDEERQELLLSVIQSLTGGRIYLHQMGERKKHLGWLQGRFVSHVTTTVLCRLLPITPMEEPDQEITIDYREEVPSLRSQRADRVKQLYDEGKQLKEIGEIMGIPHPNTITNALKEWYEREDQPYPDNGKRRGELRRLNPNGSLAKRITPEVIRLVEEGFSNQDIAKQLGCSRDLITKVLREYDRLHGTTYCDLKTRNRVLNRRPDPDQAA